MFVIHVYPIMRGVAPPMLTYFSKDAYPRTAIISVSIRKKQVSAVVAHCEDARTLKSTLRKQDHQLDAIKKQIPRFPFTEAFIAAAEAIASQDTFTVGALLYLFFEKGVLCAEASTTPLPYEVTKARPDIRAMQAPHAERIDHVRTLVREKLAQKQSTLVITPTRNEASQWFEALADIPESRRVCLHGGLTKRALTDARTRMQEAEPCVVVASQYFATDIRNDLGLILVDHVLSVHYQHTARPAVSLVPLFIALGKKRCVPTIIADTVLDVGSQVQLREGHMHPEIIRQRLTQQTPCILVDRREEKHKTLQSHPLAAKTLTHLRDALAQKRSVVVISGRRGLSTGIVCKDCRQPVLCSFCNTPYILIGPTATLNTPHFFCRRCAAREDSHRRCKNCDSWNLEAVGAGTEHLAKKLAELFPHTPVVRIDPESAKTPAQTQKLITAWRESTDASILVGTERVAPLVTTMDECVVANYDALLSAPDANSGVRTLSLLIDLREKARGSLYIETRMPEHPVLVAAHTGSVHTFISEEEQARQMLHFPPFGVFVRITRLGKRPEVQKDMVRIKKVFASYDPHFTPTWHHGRRGTMALIHIPEKPLPAALLEALRSLPPSFTITIES